MAVEAVLVELDACAGNRGVLHDARRLAVLEEALALEAAGAPGVALLADVGVVGLGEVAGAGDGPVADGAEDDVGGLGPGRGQAPQGAAVLAVDLAVLEGDVLFVEDGLPALGAELGQGGRQFAAGRQARRGGRARVGVEGVR